MGKIRVFLADDHTLFREGLAGIIASQPDLEVVGQASDGLEAVVKVRELRPDLVLMDIQMPGTDGLEATRQIKEELPNTVVIMLTVRDEPEKLFEAVKNGAQGYLLKSIRAKEMISMLRAAVEGEAALSPRMASRMLEEFRRLTQRIPSLPDGETDQLTEREHDVLSLAALGNSDKEIAQELCVSLHTVKSHIRNILSKLQAGNRREAARIARSKGIL